MYRLMAWRMGRSFGNSGPCSQKFPLRKDLRQPVVLGRITSWPKQALALSAGVRRPDPILYKVVGSGRACLAKTRFRRHAAAMGSQEENLCWSTGVWRPAGGAKGARHNFATLFHVCVRRLTGIIPSQDIREHLQEIQEKWTKSKVMDAYVQVKSGALSPFSLCCCPSNLHLKVGRFSRTDVLTAAKVGKRRKSEGRFLAQFLSTHTMRFSSVFLRLQLGNLYILWIYSQVSEINIAVLLD